MNRVVLVVCALVLSLLATQPAAQKGGNKLGTVTAVDLSVTIEAVDSDGNACAICADSQDTYITGEEGVEARFDIYGNLIVDFGHRSVEFQFPLVSDLPSGSYVDSYIATRFTPDLQDLDDGQSVCAEMNWVFRDATAEYRLLFQRGSVEDVNTSAWAVVTRVDPDTWTLEPRACDAPPDGRATGADYLAAVLSLPNRGKSVVTSYGTQSMPFKLTLTRQ